MKTHVVRFLLAAGFVALPCLLQAQPSAHYAPGVEGIKGASLPPPGVYFRDYNYFYTADQLNDASGNKNGPADLDAFTYANLPRVLWITDTKFLGGYRRAWTVFCPWFTSRPVPTRRRLIQRQPIWRR